MLDQYLRKQGVRDKTELTLLSPLNRAFTIESASRLVQPLMEARGIGLEPFFNVERVDPTAGTVSSLEGDSATFDLLVLVPPHRGQAVVESSGLGDAGAWVPTDRATLQHRRHDQIFALGDATDLPISKSGSTAHFEAPVIAGRITALVRGTAPKAGYGGRVMCFLETGDGRATALRFDYQHPPVPPAPSRAWRRLLVPDARVATRRSRHGRRGALATDRGSLTYLLDSFDGMFTAASLAHRSPGRFVESRLRLGVPLVMFVAVINPLANYLGDLPKGEAPGLWAYLQPGG